MKQRKLTMLSLLIVAVFGTCYACLGTGEVDWTRVQTEVDLAAHDVRDLAEVISDEELQGNLVTIADAMEALAQSLEGFDPEGGPSGGIRAALDVVENALLSVQGQDLSDDERIMVAAAKSVVRRIRSYLPEPE